MPTPIQDMSSWGALGSPSTRASSLDAPTTMTAADLWPPKPTDIGKRVGETRWEMSVVCEPADAMRLEFDQHHRPHATVHDMSGNTSRRLLSGLGAAMQSPTQTLTIRRQSFGNTLATLPFVELPTRDAATKAKQALRIYSTHVEEADARASRRLSEVLIARSLLSVVMIPADVSSTVFNASLMSLREAMGQPGFACRMVLMMPLGPIDGLEAKVNKLSAGHPVDIRVSPAVVRPLDAWNYLRSAWNLVTRVAAEDGDSSLMLLPDPTSSHERAPLPMRTASAARSSASAARDTVEALRRRLLAENEAEQKINAQKAPRVAEAEAARAQHAARAAAAAAVPSMPMMIDVPALTASAPPVSMVGMSPLARQHMAMASPTSAPLSTLGPAPLPLIAESLARREPDPEVPINATRPADLTPLMPAEASAQAVSPALLDFLAQCAEIKGLQACWIIDVALRQMIASHGVTNAAAYAADGTRLINALRAAAMAFQMPGRVPETILSYERHHMVMMPLPGHERLAALAIFDKVGINAVVAQLKMQRIGQGLAPPQAPVATP